ncbi:MAG: LysM peptidoglycan-binding domain-containing protein [Calditrichaceae bacterium]|nr:LysM peptidoglycan-binding domain-containing protein [Calditrichaceae bacterium]RQV96960.1 MAG: LysM peptidoglycan-binding domain-containing protein [Calditrichota bacterium]
MIHKFQWKILLIFLIVFRIGYSGGLNYSSKDLFPVHHDMVDACEFWVKIFSKYHTNEYVIHDSKKLGLIYEVVKWGELDESKMDDPFTSEQKKYFKNRMNYYEGILTGMAAVYPDTVKMNGEQKKLFRKLKGFKSKNDILEATGRLRVQKGQKNKFLQGLEISGRYMPYLKEIFTKHGLPEELTVLPHVESSFNYKAYSSAGAAGIWQFTRGTGDLYLNISYEIDERLDPIMATEAAAKLLKHNYKELGSWPLAITAYNHGLYGMKQAVRKLNTMEMNTIINKYRSRYFKFASKNFYCEFIAALHIVQNYEQYFPNVNLEPPIQYKEYPLPHYIKYETLSEYLKIEKEQFKKYNPALRVSVYNNSKLIPKGYRLKLPLHISADELMAEIPKTAYSSDQKESRYYRIRYGDTLSDIARKFGTSVSTLLSLNNLSNEHYIRRGMTIRIPDKAEAPVVLAAAPEENILKQEEPIHQDIIAEEDTVQEEEDMTISEELVYAEPEEETELALFFGLTEPFAAESTITAPAPPQTNGRNLSDLEIEFIRQAHPATGYIRVEPEETLGHYSDWLQIKTQSIRNWNNLSFRTPIRLKQKLKLVFENVTPDEFNSMRLEYHRGIEEDFFLNYEITDTQTYQVKKGDNLWYLCNYVYNLPYWLIVDYNEDIDFESLKPGDTLIIPNVKAKKP